MTASSSTRAPAMKAGILYVVDLINKEGTFELLPAYAMRTESGLTLYRPLVATMTYVGSPAKRDEFIVLNQAGFEGENALQKTIRIDRDRVAAMIAESTSVPSSYMPDVESLAKLGDEVHLKGYAKGIVVGITPCGGRFIVAPHGAYDAKYSYQDLLDGRLTRQTFENLHWSEVSVTGYGEKSLMDKLRPSYLTIDYTKQTLQGLILNLTTNNIVDSQDYQRDYVWQAKDKAAFIEGLINGKDVGKFVFLQGIASETLEIVDGKQRCQALMAYLGNHFPVKGAYFRELDRRTVRQVMGQMVNIAILNPNQYDKLRCVETFLDINDTGVPQSPLHLEYVREMAEELKAQSAASS